MKLRHLVVLRGGSYEGPDRHLTAAARTRVEGLALELRLIGISRPEIWCSPVPCAKQTAAILSRALPAVFRPIPQLEADEHEANTADRGQGKLLAIHELIEKEPRSSSDLVIISHDFVVAEFPEFFVRRYLNLSVRSVKVNRGEGWYINCQPRLIGQDSNPILKRLVPQLA